MSLRAPRAFLDSHPSSSFFISLELIACRVQLYVAFRPRKEIIRQIYRYQLRGEGETYARARAFSFRFGQVTNVGSSREA